MQFHKQREAAREEAIARTRDVYSHLPIVQEAIAYLIAEEESVLSEVKVLGFKKPLVILGGVGVGKTTLVQKRPDLKILDLAESFDEDEALAAFIRSNPSHADILSVPASEKLRWVLWREGVEFTEVYSENMKHKSLIYTSMVTVFMDGYSTSRNTVSVNGVEVAGSNLVILKSGLYLSQYVEKVFQKKE